MIPATHAAVSAVATARIRSLALALAASFALHFILDAIYHFEAVYPVSVPGKWSEGQIRLVLFAGLAALGVPIMAWVWRKSRQVFRFGCYALLMSTVIFEPVPGWRLTWAALLTAIWLVLTPAASGRRWVLCGFAGYFPDWLKTVFPPVEIGRAHV